GIPGTQTARNAHAPDRLSRAGRILLRARERLVMGLEDLASLKVEKIASGFEFTEGPVFHRLGYLLFSDIPRGRIMKWQAGSTAVPFRGNSNGANGLTFDHQGRLLACERDRVTRTEKNGKVTVLADQFEGKKLLSPNDLIYAIDGSIYFTVLHERNAPADAVQAVYQI